MLSVLYIQHCNHIKQDSVNEQVMDAILLRISLNAYLIRATLILTKKINGSITNNSIEIDKKRSKKKNPKKPELDAGMQ